MTPQHCLTALTKRPLALLTLALMLIAAGVFPAGTLVAGTGGVPGQCYFITTVKGKTTTKECDGTDLPMWYSTSQNPTYNQGDFPCGWYGNQDCGMETGDPLGE